MQQGQFSLPTVTPFNKILMISLGVLFLVNSLFGLSGMSLEGLFGLSGQGFFSGHIYRLFTFPFLPRNLMETIFDILIFWFIGSELESMWAKKRYIGFLAASALGQGIIFLAINFLFFQSKIYYAIPLLGPSGVCSALCVAYGILFPNRQMYFFFFPILAKWFVVLIVGMNLYNGIFSPGGIYAWAQIAAMISGYGWMLWVSRTQAKSSSSPFSRPPKKRKQGHLKLVDDEKNNEKDDDDEITYH
jgi:membrane associated rhomboid family serine protease